VRAGILVRRAATAMRAEDALAGRTEGGGRRPASASGADQSAAVTFSETHLEALRYSHWRGTVGFHDVANAWFATSDPRLPESLRREYQQLFPGLLDAFTEPRRGIVSSYFCEHVWLAAALTDIGHAAGAPEGVPEASLKGPPPAGIREAIGDSVSGDEWRPTYRRRSARWYREPVYRRRLHIGDPAPASASALHLYAKGAIDVRVRDLLSRCMDLHYRAIEFLTPQPRKLCVEMIFDVIEALLGELDVPADGREMPQGLSSERLEALEQALARARAYFDRSAQRHAQFEYYRGMGLALLMTLACVGLVALVGSVLDWRFVEVTAGQALLLSAALGASGSLISATTRINRARFDLPQGWDEAGTKTLRAMGTVRTFMGAMFGIVAYVLLAGGLLSVSGPEQSDLALYFYAGVGFLAGFTERLAGDALSSPPADRAGPAN
jgi:hypothetical protein